MTDQKPDIKLIVVDVDSTLLNSDHKLSERNESALKKAIAKGVQIMLATGKNYGSCKDIIKQLGITTPGIFTQGLVIHEATGAIRHQQTLDNNIVRRVITFAEDRGFAIGIYSQGRILARAANPYIDELHTKWGDLQPEYVGPLQNVLGTLPVNKLVAISAYDDRKTKSLRWQLSTQVNGSARLMNGGVHHMLEILPPNGSKGNALRALLKEMKIDPANVMAIGDAENDVEMIQLAGLGVAVGNAQQVLKDAADEITTSNDDDGVALMIEKYVLDETPSADATPEDEKPDEPETVTKPEDALAATEATAPKPEDQESNS